MENSGYAGGLVVAWKLYDIRLIMGKKEMQFIHFKMEIEKEEWYFTAIYASPNELQKNLLWKELQNLAGSIKVSLSRCKRFRDRMDTCRVNDVESNDPKFTWRGPIYHGGQRIYEKLDRALSNDDWRIQFPKAYVKFLVRVEFSDHHRILINLKEDNFEHAPNSFRFENVWVLNESYHDMLQKSWTTNIPIRINLNNVVEDIDRWKFDTFDKIKRRKKEIIKRLEGTQKKLQLQDNYGGMRKLEANLQEELSGILNQEEIMWHQRSRTTWNKYDVGYSILSSDRVNEIKGEISYAKVKNDVFSMKPWKALGPDGFPAGFYQKSWDVVGNDVYNFVKEEWKCPSMISEIKKTNICLIPKVEQPQTINQFRTISLCNTIYKIINKVAVSRLKSFMAYLVSPYQTGFVPSLSIHENIIIANEVTHCMNNKKGKHRLFAIKIDLSKAYHKLNWEFIWRIISEVGIQDDMINIIMHGVISVETNVNWNGNHSEFFRPHRGIRQGDPISPYLFVMCIDKLSHLIEHESYSREECYGSYSSLSNDDKHFADCEHQTYSEVTARFIWGDTKDKKKFHAVSWDAVTKPKDARGLGLRDMHVMNECNTMRGKYKIESRNTQLKEKGSNSALWKSIVKTSANLRELGVWRTGDGADVKTWQDCWVEAGEDGDWNWRIMEWIRP
ncbi:uncharacterized protein LOC131624735 [Vicia villosa]|uniref:uncharacterized protein LOC131624735 n=1 Tax=Vicia villosa TaxID=3911 RepID=UPI00273CB411|nr:uncharacterized protein LOC131624735 [Vicia villosa]